MGPFKIRKLEKPPVTQMPRLTPLRHKFTDDAPRNYDPYVVSVVTPDWPRNMCWKWITPGESDHVFHIMVRYLRETPLGPFAIDIGYGFAIGVDMESMYESGEVANSANATLGLAIDWLNSHWEEYR